MVLAVEKWLRLRILQERYGEGCLWRVQRINTTCLPRSRSSWLAWVSGQFWLLSSIRNREPCQSESIVDACQGRNHEGKQKQTCEQRDGLRLLATALLHLILTNMEATMKKA